ncbi:DUF4190 domain-containing protein [Streptomyces sp. C11-1]|uniref:DUF4190 domain-containing protein n=1 Tax=Streptomyces durocortorensis TaxID=2811104 RepID=A0ABY9W139_9ACTN|nr:DUF4190 domain-containing protein [Streptomyces durocortorensis]WNF29189.1 DUF4190 domain-containing protein [Streptomyces durocortorensis]
MTVPPPPHSPVPPAPPAAGPHGPWQPVPRQPLSGLAVASLVLSLLVCLAPVGLVLGIVALVRLPRTGRRGKGLAVAGTAVGGAVVALSALLLVVGGVRFTAWTGEGPSPFTPGDRTATSLYDLAEEDCFTPASGLPTPGGDRLKTMSAEIVPCDEPHQGQVYGSFELTGKAFPGAAAVADAANKGCAPLLHDFALDTTALPRSQMFYYHPDSAGWASGNRTVLCWLGSTAGPLEESLRQDLEDWDEAQFAYLMALRPASEARVSRPATAADDDLAGATAWAGRMAAGTDESARILRVTGGLPAEAEDPVTAFADRLEQLSGVMSAAAKARTPQEFEKLTNSIGEDDGSREERAVRDALGLRLPGGGDLAG